MAVFKKNLTAIGRGKIHTQSGKGARSQMLPSRSAMQTLTDGSPGDRTLQNYAKATQPVGAPSIPGPSPIAPMGASEFGAGD